MSSQGCVHMHFESAGGEKVLAEQSFSNWNLRVSKKSEEACRVHIYVILNGFTASMCIVGI